MPLLAPPTLKCVGGGARDPPEYMAPTPMYKTRILSASHACHNYTHAHRSQMLMHCNGVQPGRDVLKTLSHKTQAETFQTETTSLQLGSRGSVFCPPSSPLPAFRATEYICQVEKSHLMFKFMYVGLTFRGESGDAVSASKFGACLLYTSPSPRDS